MVLLRLRFSGRIIIKIVEGEKKKGFAPGSLEPHLFEFEEGSGAVASRFEKPKLNKNLADIVLHFSAH